jgi:hypothetical protein
MRAKSESEPQGLQLTSVVCQVKLRDASKLVEAMKQNRSSCPGLWRIPT